MSVVYRRFSQELSRVERSLDGQTRLEHRGEELAGDRRNAARIEWRTIQMRTGQRSGRQERRNTRALRHGFRLLRGERRQSVLEVFRRVSAAEVVAKRYGSVSRCSFFII